MSPCIHLCYPLCMCFIAGYNIPQQLICGTTIIVPHGSPPRGVRKVTIGEIWILSCFDWHRHLTKT